LWTLKSNGFEIQKEEIDSSREHFEIDFNDTERIANYLISRGVKDVDIESINIMRGMVIGLDMEYNPSPTKAIAVDIYPIKLPDIIDIALRDSGDESAIIG